MLLPLPMSGINITIFTRNHNTFIFQDQKFSILRWESFQELLVIVSKGKVSWNINSSLIKILITIITPVIHWDVKSRGIGMYKSYFSQRNLLHQRRMLVVWGFFPKLTQSFYVLQTFKASKSWKRLSFEFFWLSYLQIRSNFIYNSNTFRKCNSIGVFGREEK